MKISRITIKREKSDWIKTLLVFIVLLYFVSHLPFLSADADLTMATTSRGAWTDEGLNTCQIRNYINHGHFDLLECDNLLKTPLFSGVLFIPFTLFGTHMEVARICTIFLVCLVLLTTLSSRKLSVTACILVFTTLTLFPVHQFSHMALAEMPAIAAILLAGFMFYFFNESGKMKFLILSFLAALLAVLFKIQYFYSLFIPLGAVAFQFNKYKNIEYKKTIALSFLILISALSLLYFFWYLPFRNEWAIISAIQSVSFSAGSFSVSSIKDNVTHCFFIRSYIIFFVVFLIALIIAIYKSIMKRYTAHYQSLILFGLIWFLLELHKLPMEYLPIRYSLSLYFSMGFLISAVFAGFFDSAVKPAFRISVALMIIALLSVNVYKYTTALKNRTYSVSEINRYMAQKTSSSEVVIGAWAPSLTWESQNIAIPVWRDYYKSNIALTAYKPNYIFSEPDEAESNQAYSTAGIDPDSISDLCQQFTIAYWKVNLYRIIPSAGKTE